MIASNLLGVPNESLTRRWAVETRLRLDHIRGNVSAAFLVFIFSLASLSICACSSKQWSQFHADAPSQGYQGVHSAVALEKKWSRDDVGPVSFASPVVGADGTIYIGNTRGELVAIRGDGSQVLWRYDASKDFKDATIVSSAAVGEDGDIYFIANFTYAVTPLPIDVDPAEPFRNTYRSVLISLRPDMSLKGSYVFDNPTRKLFGYTTASPKTLSLKGSLQVFVPNSTDLYVFNDKIQLIHREPLYCPVDVSGGFNVTWDFTELGRLYDYRYGPHKLEAWYDPTGAQNWLDPTVAVATRLKGKDLVEPLVVVAHNFCGLTTFSWSPPPRQSLTKIWSVGEPNEIYSSPALGIDGTLVVGRADGHVLGYDAQVHKPVLWDFDASSPVVSTPSLYAGFLSVFFASQNKLFALDNYGNLVHVISLSNPTGASAATTMNAVYLTTLGAIHAFDINLSIEANDYTTAGGMSSPAVTGDGTVLVATPAGTLTAYKRN